MRFLLLLLFSTGLHGGLWWAAETIHPAMPQLAHGKQSVESRSHSPLSVQLMSATSHLPQTNDVPPKRLTNEKSQPRSRRFAKRDFALAPPAEPASATTSFTASPLTEPAQPQPMPLQRPSQRPTPVASTTVPSAFPTKPVERQTAQPQTASTMSAQLDQGVITDAERIGEHDFRRPDEAARLGLTGTVILRVRISAEGRVVEANVETSSGHAILDLAALRDVYKHEFIPARRGNKRIAQVRTWPIIY